MQKTSFRFKELDMTFLISSCKKLNKSILLSATLLLLIIHSLSWAHSSLEREMELQKMFQLRKEDEWKSVWHSEKHPRCRDQLLTQMDWACQKDIYRLDKRGMMMTSMGEAELPALEPFMEGIVKAVDEQDGDDSRNGGGSSSANMQEGIDIPIGIFIDKELANTMIKPWSGHVARTKRESKSITDECCNTSGCTWEEYAEYCPAHRRARISARSRT